MIYSYNRRYLGNKQKLTPFIVKEITAYPIKSIADLFAGTGAVTDALYNLDKTLVINDILYANYLSYHAFFGTESIDHDLYIKHINECNQLPLVEGYFYTHFKDTYLSAFNTKKLDSIRLFIESLKHEVSFRHYALLITSLIYEIDRIANTTGHYDAYLKTQKRTSDLTIKPIAYKQHNPNVIIYNKDALELAPLINTQAVYIDPPYNGRGYENLYHFLENVACFKQPQVEGVTKKYVGRDQLSTPFTKKEAPKAFHQLITELNTSYIFVSFSFEVKDGVFTTGSRRKITHDEILSILKEKGDVNVVLLPTHTYKSHQHMHNQYQEVLYTCIVRH